jgi:hypothetical protein
MANFTCLLRNGNIRRFTLQESDLKVDNKRSLVRVKIWALEIVFVVCWLLLRFEKIGDGSMEWVYEELMFEVASVVAVLMFFVRCEKCHTIEILGQTNNSLWSSFIPKWSGLLPPKHCPVCGKERY